MFQVSLCFFVGTKSGGLFWGEWFPIFVLRWEVFFLNKDLFKNCRCLGFQVTRFEGKPWPTKQLKLSQLSYVDDTTYLFSSCRDFLSHHFFFKHHPANPCCLKILGFLNGKSLGSNLQLRYFAGKKSMGFGGLMDGIVSRYCQHQQFKAYELKMREDMHKESWD